jgi:thiosulfate reductase cytochrome b subunit
MPIRALQIVDAAGTADVVSVAASPPRTDTSAHALWVRVSHWILAASICTLAFTGFIILMAHPRLYWGETGNNLTPALLELPISRNHRHGGWQDRVPFFGDPSSAVTANRTFDIFNQNGWGRSLHFLAAWLVVVPGAIYLLAGVFTGHFRRHLWPRRGELQTRALRTELADHLHLRIRPATGGPDYGLLQKCGYCAVVFVLLPLIVLTGLAMSPTVAAAYPFLQSMWGGFQSARTIHFFAFVALVLFTIGHVALVAMSGLKRQLRGMIRGR